MHKKFLLDALAQARLGRGSCAPNPSVGAVAVQNGAIIARSYHKAFGEPHAEPLALEQFPPKMPGVSLYVSLEPCNHWGKTPPCVDAIIKHDIGEVIFAYKDPNPIIAKRNSSEILKAHGIKVTHFPVAEISEFYQSYTNWTLTKKPTITVKIAHTLNGKIALASGKPVRLSNDLCEQFTHQQRASTDIILTTAKTVQSDNPKMNVRLNDEEHQKPVAIIDSHLSLEKTAAIFSAAKHCHIFYCENDPKAVSYPNSTYHLMPTNNGKMDLKAMIGHLGALGYHDVWVEAGGTLFSSLHKEGLVHKTYLYIVPKLLEEHDISAFIRRDIFDKNHTVSWRAMGDNMIAYLEWLD
jgi:diaminohydroxyphosphoribosylaminopyrimidine deaminase/5-amino-6-(5-phosphoribosylamino)uracil reductase